MRILIAGGMGYIGSALLDLYRHRTDVEITIVDKKFVPERVANLPPHMRYVQGDITDKDLMSFLVQDIDLLHLLAAEVEAENSRHKEAAVWEQNFDAPKELIELCGMSTRIMFPSTGNVFGGANTDGKWSDLTEEDKPQPKFPYAETKVAMEAFLRDSGRDHVILRFGTNHGYAPLIRFNLVTNNFVKKALTGEDLTVHGQGDNVRPTTCVQDCARALIFLSEMKEAKREIFHVVRENVKIRELAERAVTFCSNRSRICYIAKEVPFSGYALSNRKLLEWGFRFEWDLDSSIQNMSRVFHAMIPAGMQSALHEKKVA